MPQRRAGRGRAFYQDLMKGETLAKKQASEQRARGNGRDKTKAINTAEWTQRKIAEGDIGGGLAANTAGEGTSIFDPVLCELIYRWFCPPKGIILDPFAGGSVRGIVAGCLGRRYIGVDLSAQQLEANRAQARAILKPGMPRPDWIEGDSRNIIKLTGGGKWDGLQADLLFSCPPYADLEVYSDDERDLSTLKYPAFRDAYRKIIAASCQLLGRDRFACFVVGDVRDQKGIYYGFVPDTIEAFRAAGLQLYNEAILVTAVGSLPLRVGRQFQVSRKLGKTHQNVLVFVKGDPAKAAKAIGEVEFGDGPLGADQQAEPTMENIGGEIQ